MSASHILTNGDVCQKWWDIWFKLRFEDTRVRLSWFLPTFQWHTIAKALRFPYYERKMLQQLENRRLPWKTFTLPPELWHISFRRLFQQSGPLITSINGDGTVVTSVFSHDVTNPLTTMNPQCSCGKIQLSCSFLGACSHYAGSKSNVCWCCGEDCAVRASSAKWNISFSAPDTKHGSFDCSYIAQAVYWISA